MVGGLWSAYIGQEFSDYLSQPLSKAEICNVTPYPWDSHGETKLSDATEMKRTKPTQKKNTKPHPVLCKTKPPHIASVRYSHRYLTEYIAHAIQGHPGRSLVTSPGLDVWLYHTAIGHGYIYHTAILHAPSPLQRRAALISGPSACQGFGTNTADSRGGRRLRQSLGWPSL